MGTPSTRSAVFLLPLLLGASGCDRQPPYHDCNRDLPCGSEASLCLATTTATRRTALFCTSRCATPAATSSECPGSAACATLNGATVCLQRCTLDADCSFTGAVCSTIDTSMGARVCVARP